MVLAANAPDFDVVTWLASRPAWLHWHRNVTHALLFVPVMAILSVVLVRWIGRKEVRWLPAFGIAAVGVLSHLALDMTNAYGVRLLLPFSPQWFSWDTTPVVDVALWAILLLGLAMPVLAGLVAGEIGEKRNPNRGTGAAITALLLLTAYDAGRAFLHQRAMGLMAAQQVMPEQPRRIAAFPEANPLKWIGIAELSNSWAQIPVDLRDGRLHANELQTIFKAEPVTAIEVASRESAFQTLSEFAQYPLWTVEPAPDDPGARQVTLLDLRFGEPVSPGFASARAVVDALNRVKSTSFGVGPANIRPR